MTVFYFPTTSYSQACTCFLTNSIFFLPDFLCYYVPIQTIMLRMFSFNFLLNIFSTLMQNKNHIIFKKGTLSSSSVPPSHSLTLSLSSISASSTSIWTTSTGILLNWTYSVLLLIRQDLCIVNWRHSFWNLKTTSRVIF